MYGEGNERVKANLIPEHKSCPSVYIFKNQKSKKKKGLKLENSWGTKNLNLRSIDLPTEASLSKVKVNSAALLYKVSQLVLYEQL